MSYPSTLHPTVALPALPPAGEDLAMVELIPWIIGGRFALARQHLSDPLQAHRLLAVLATWNCGSWLGIGFPFADRALLADDVTIFDNRIIGYFQIDSRRSLPFPPTPGSVHASLRLRQLWTAPMFLPAPR